MFNYLSTPDEKLKKIVWNKGHIIVGYDKEVWRRDDYGYAIRFSDHGNRNSKYGWEIDHIQPIMLGGGHDLSNLRPLYWHANVTR